MASKQQSEEETEPRLFIHDRWNRIVALLNADSVTSVEELAGKLSVSPATVRRDLSELSDHGRLRRVRGGALAPAPSNEQPFGSGRLVGQAPHTDSSVANIDKKRAIGALAAGLVSPGEAVIIDGGTTTQALAEHLGEEELTVFTSSVPILVALMAKPKVRVMIGGGEVFKTQNIILNPYGDSIADRFSATKLFIGAQALTERGLMQTDPLLVQNEQGFIRQAEEVIVLVDSSKFGAKGSLSVCGLDAISTVVTDEGVPDAARRMLASAGVRLLEARLSS